MDTKLHNYLAVKLFGIFASRTYTEDKQLQEDFAEFKLTNLGQYHRIIDTVLQDNPDYAHLTWRDVKIHPKRWHLCKNCQQPFIATDKFNKQQICRHAIYTRYGKDGFYKSSGKSECQMRTKAKNFARFQKTS